MSAVNHISLSLGRRRLPCAPCCAPRTPRTPYAVPQGMFFDHYISFFFDQGLIVLICFSLFSSFAILSDNGQLSSFLQESQVDARSKLSRHLAVRSDMITESIACHDQATARMKKIAGSYGTALSDIAAMLGIISRKLLVLRTAARVRYACDTLASSSRLASSAARGYTARLMSLQGSKAPFNSGELVLVA